VGENRVEVPRVAGPVRRVVCRDVGEATESAQAVFGLPEVVFGGGSSGRSSANLWSGGLSAPGGLRRGDGALFWGPPSFLREIPSSPAQDAMSTQVLVLIAYLLRMQHRAAQDAMRLYILEHKGESRGLQASIGGNPGIRPGTLGRSGQILAARKLSRLGASRGGRPGYSSSSREASGSIARCCARSNPRTTLRREISSRAATAVGERPRWKMATKLTRARASTTDGR